ncbi:hypothetical protein NNJEOMEG_04018 [Fundidesulfovibrio magnetotacticus]|uniref:Uncharacterized protein n=1 Tax=Fundidesulfovibrio magnetotacticus TaxID=2730080 RepID=A0A6V8M123_9BACT|nr:hypothetical protein NNJEOMEG_04018 [Fundidesulfovibrio magnetotacticus]
MSSVTGASSSTVVTLSSSAEATAVTMEKMTMTRKGSPLATLALLMATYWNTPVLVMMFTMTIMEMSRKMTFQSTPRSMSCSASCCVSTLVSSVSAAPAMATLVLWTFSETITA